MADDKTFISDESFVELLESQRHRCRSGRQIKDLYSLSDLYLEVEQTYNLINKEINLNNYSESISILDVGCGLGYIDAVFYHKLNPKPNLYLFDAASTFEYKKGDTKKNKKFYSNLNLTKKFLQLNKVQEQNINLLNAEESSALTGLKDSSFDIVISLFSWFWHYQNQSYLEHSHRILKDDGALIFNFKCREASHQEGKINLIKEIVQGYFKIQAVVSLDGELLFILKKIIK